MRCIINVWIVFRCVSTWVFLCLQNNNSALEKYRNSNETKPWKHIYGIHSAYSFHISHTHTHFLCPSALFLFGIFESWLAGVYSGTLFTLNTFSLHSNIFFYILISVRLYVFTGGATINTKRLSQSKKRNNSKNASSFRGPPEVEYGKINYTIKCTPTTL